MIIRPAKVGTVPALIVFKYNYKIELNKRILFRFYNDNKWLSGIIDDFNDDCIFINLM